VNAAEGRNTGDVSEADGRAGETEEKSGDMAKLKTRHKFKTKNMTKKMQNMTSMTDILNKTRKALGRSGDQFLEMNLESRRVCGSISKSKCPNADITPFKSYDPSFCTGFTKCSENAFLK